MLPAPDWSILFRDVKPARGSGTRLAQRWDRRALIAATHGTGPEIGQSSRIWMAARTIRIAVAEVAEQLIKWKDADGAVAKREKQQADMHTVECAGGARSPSEWESFSPHTAEGPRREN